MRLIADRGFGGLYPENTLRAVEEAVALADEIAVDVRRCGSGELVVVRDETVDRVSDGTGRVADLPVGELAALDVLGTGSGVPTLWMVLEAVPRGIGVVVRLRETGLVEDALRAVAGARTHCVLAATDPADLAAASKLRPEVPRAFLADGGTDPHDAVTTARGLDCRYLHAPLAACTERLVGEAHVAGMSVNARGVTAKGEAERLESVGVDGVVADRWGVLPAVEP